MSTPSISFMREISHDFRSNNAPEAYKKFAQLDPETKNRIYYHIWALKGKDAYGPRFGETAFYHSHFSMGNPINPKEFHIKNKVRAKSIDLQASVYQVDLLRKIITDSRDGKPALGYEKFSKLPADIQNKIFKKIWKLDGSSHSHPQFGELAFYGKNFEISYEIRMKSLEYYSNYIFLSQIVAPNIKKCLSKMIDFEKIVPTVEYLEDKTEVLNTPFTSLTIKEIKANEINFRCSSPVRYWISRNLTLPMYNKYPAYTYALSQFNEFKQKKIHEAEKLKKIWMQSLRALKYELRLENTELVERIKGIHYFLKNYFNAIPFELHQNDLELIKTHESLIKKPSFSKDVKKVPKKYLYKWVIESDEIFIKNSKNKIVKCYLNKNDCECSIKTTIDINFGNIPDNFRSNILSKHIPDVNDKDVIFQIDTDVKHRTYNLKGKKIFITQKGKDLFWVVKDRITNCTHRCILVSDFIFWKNYINITSKENYNFIHQEFSKTIIDIMKGKIKNINKENSKGLFFLRQIPINERLSLLDECEIFFDSLQNGSQKISIEKKEFKSVLNPNESIDMEAWAVTLINSLRPTSDPKDYYGHAQLVIETVIRGNHIIKIADFWEKGIRFIKNVSKELLLYKIAEKTDTWVRPREKVEKLIQKIKWEKRKLKEGLQPVQFGLAGRNSILQKVHQTQGINWDLPDNESLGDNEHIIPPLTFKDNCITWAKDKLKIIDVFLPQGSCEWLFTTPSEFIKS